MAKQKGMKKRPARGGPGGAPRPEKRTKRRDAEEEEKEDEEADFLGEEGAQEHGGAPSEEGSEQEPEETADEKRLRLAKAYLARVRAAADADVSGEEDEDADRAVHRDSLVAARLQSEVAEASGRAQRPLAARVVHQGQAPPGVPVGRRHRHAVTALALTHDDTQAFAASKDGVVVQWNVEKGGSSALPLPEGARMKALLALAVSSDGRYLAAGGVDRSIHVWDVRAHQYLRAFSGHRGTVSSLAFRVGTAQLFSGSFDRSIKLWSLDDMAYMDSLFGHQSEVVAVDCLRAERVLSAGRDRTCRLWKVPEETQLVFRGHAAAIDCAALITPTDFISGSEDGSVALWSHVRKKPVHLVRGAHGAYRSTLDQQAAAASTRNGDAAEETGPDGEARDAGGHEAAPGEASSSSSAGAAVGGAAAGWVGAVAVCRGSDLAASGAGDGAVRLWGLHDGNKRLRPLHTLPTAGFVNALAFAASGRFLLAGTGQEPRLGRWARIPQSRNGVVMHSIQLEEL
ncbi:U3 snoRNP-associated 55-kDa protein RRP9 [Klebsormidium nitens]|uniref:U3 snoRNP-associated 55-kDa protein RRP9 n=1 Tax=Klebsormidium nitens TaxID=105231 RepID=A0A1Y1IGX0_KLENI|nr:U3 snoRNP-associated 55-kDa protein RRP9 [Klebsormidium nitens]|eukprot:GAQ90124.1 U3 snoRNP-associated 55-kDa protein RRP9 [Klebsormidium nitens]